MSKLIENLSDTILSRWDKKHINDKGEKIVTSLLTRFALNKGIYLSNELEFQHQDERIQFRANKNDTVTLGLLLDHLFDIQKDEISDLYIITENRRGKTGTSITETDAVWNLDLCSIMVDKENKYEFNNSVTLSVSYHSTQDNEEHLIYNENSCIIIYLKQSGGDEETMFFRVSIMKPVSENENDINFSRTSAIPETISFLVAYDHTDSKKRIAKFEKKMDKAVRKYKNGKELTEDEQYMIAKVVPEVLWNYSWGNDVFQQKRYLDAIVYLENVYYELRERLLRLEMTEDEKWIFFQTCYLIGFSYMELDLPEKAYFYLDIIWPLEITTYNIEYINCLANNKDVRAINIIDDELERLEGLSEDEMPEDFELYRSFLNRRRAYVLIDMGLLDEAEEAFKKLLMTDDRKKEYIEQELEYIKELREQQSE